MKSIITVLFISLFTTSLYAADSYLCIAEQAAGFTYNKKTKKWSGANSTNNRKFIVKKSKDKKYSWNVSEHGINNSDVNCKYDFNNYGYLECGDIRKFEMNKQTLRFRYEYIFGYVVHKGFFGKKNNEEEGDSPPYILIGKCRQRIIK